MSPTHKALTTRCDRPAPPPHSIRIEEDTVNAIQQPASQRILVRGVRTQSAGRVQLWSLRDGWAVFPDWDATHRRWVTVGLAGAALLFVIAPILLKLVGIAGTAVGVLAIVLLVASWIGDTRAQRRARLQKQQLRFDAIHRAGGLDSLQWAATTGGRAAHTVAELNIWLTAAGLDTPVISTATVSHATMHRTRSRVDARITLNNGTTITYRVRGRHAPDKLVNLISSPLGDKCAIT
jgi:hypothetical protein